MSTRKSTTTRLKAQPAFRLLTDDEIKRIAEKLAVRIEHDEEETALLLLWIQHLEALVEAREYNGLWSALYDFRKHLFLGCPAADAAQDAFQADAYRNRGKLLLWPYERKGAA